MDLAGREHRRGVARDRPRAALVLAHGEERDVAEQVVTGANDAIEPRFAQAEIRHERGGVGGIELRDFQLDLRADRHRPRGGARQERFEPGEPNGVVGLRQILFVQIEHDQQRLGGEKLEAIRAEPKEQQIKLCIADVLQIPAFLCRQTDFVVAVAQSGKVVNVKKGQFLAPWDIGNIVDKILSANNDQILLTERGASFGYNNLVSDMRSLVVMRELGYPVVFDATHSLQLPGGLGKASGGERKYIGPLARAGVAAGVDALFMEVHENPDQALSDGPNSLPLREFEGLLRIVKEIDGILKR